MSYSNETHKSIRKFAETVIEHEKVMQFWCSTHRQMEIYIIAKNKFYTFCGKEIKEEI